jgi:AbrB family looped-hinge helix DNA binding protein
VVPKEIRERHGWSAGSELMFEDLGDRVILREVRDVPETRLEDLIGCTGYRGPARTLKEMEDGISAGHASGGIHDRHRYERHCPGR